MRYVGIHVASYTQFQIDFSPMRRQYEEREIYLLSTDP